MNLAERAAYLQSSVGAAVFDATKRYHPAVQRSVENCGIRYSLNLESRDCGSYEAYLTWPNSEAADHFHLQKGLPSVNQRIYRFDQYASVFERYLFLFNEPGHPPTTQAVTLEGGLINPNDPKMQNLAALSFYRFDDEKGGVAQLIANLSRYGDRNKRTFSRFPNTTGEIVIDSDHAVLMRNDGEHYPLRREEALEYAGLDNFSMTHGPQAVASKVSFTRESSHGQALRYEAYLGGKIVSDDVLQDLFAKRKRLTRSYFYQGLASDPLPS